MNYFQCSNAYEIYDDINKFKLYYINFKEFIGNYIAFINIKHAIQVILSKPTQNTHNINRKSFESKKKYHMSLFSEQVYNVYIFTIYISLISNIKGTQYYSQLRIGILLD